MSCVLPSKTGQSPLSRQSTPSGLCLQLAVSSLPHRNIQFHDGVSGGSLKSATVGVFTPQELANSTNQSSAPPSQPVKSQLLGVYPHTSASSSCLCARLKMWGKILSNTSKPTHISLWSLRAYKTVQYSLYGLVLSTSHEGEGQDTAIPIVKMRDTG